MTNAPHPSQMIVGSSTGMGPVAAKPTRDNKEEKIVAAVVVLLATAIAGYWFYSEQSKIGIGNGLSDNVVSAPGSISGPGMPVSATPEQPLARPKTETLHPDVYFDFSRSRLNDEAKTALQEQAEILKRRNDWTLLLQGYTDQRGPSEYNRALGLRRAETVKNYLVGLGLPDTSIKVMSLGKEGALCDEGSKECWQRNRRVHLELVKGVAQKPVPAPILATRDEEHLDTSKPAGAVSEKADPIIRMDSEITSPPSQ
ncbi:MAG: hypothetical protein E6K63_03025 [Nitrospirae bacterium]|nr:MAG: hypothetical protein E6K63_03025 [Nitrospirota bacterium]